ncbi:hypothetical protein [Segeticoccus rhizosphaerae]|uniref:hypothetical protein n=1 Tax=Segeticoccus rhizosphaerae TaxID=1104777 RepID=UPI0010BFF0E9|nr:hypothetical protein [Ornithinicoccus soli]
MGLTGTTQQRLARWAAYRPHLLLVTAPGGTEQRLAVETHVSAIGGVLADTPAGADLLVVAGTPSAQLAEAAELVWAQVPAPRVRLHLVDPATTGVLLDAGVRELATLPGPDAAQNEAARSHDRADPAEQHTGGHEHRAHTDPERREHDGHHMDAEPGTNHGGPRGHQEHAARDGDGSGHGARGEDGQGHAGHPGHGGHEGQGGHEGMQMPGGLMMADRAPDRDGLKLDVLHVPLGPVLPAWPAGLVVDTQLQGDLVQAAATRVLATSGAKAPGFWADPAPTRRAAAHLDSLSRLLQVAGWPGAGAEAARRRDRLLATSGEVPGDGRQGFARWRSRVERSWTLRRSLQGLGRLAAVDVERLGLSGPAARATARGGDAWARVVTWLDETATALDGRVVAPGESSRGTSGRGSTALLRAAVELMPGLDLAGARLVMASLDPDTDEVGLT